MHSVEQMLKLEQPSNCEIAKTQRPEKSGSRSAHQTVILVLEGAHHGGHVLLQLGHVLAVCRDGLFVRLGHLGLGDSLQLSLVDGELNG